MKLVIDIDEKDYKQCKYDLLVGPVFPSTIMIANGVPLDDVEMQDKLDLYQRGCRDTKLTIVSYIVRLKEYYSRERDHSITRSVLGKDICKNILENLKEM